MTGAAAEAAAAAVPRLLHVVPVRGHVQDARPPLNAAATTGKYIDNTTNIVTTVVAQSHVCVVTCSRWADAIMVVALLRSSVCRVPRVPPPPCHHAGCRTQGDTRIFLFESIRQKQPKQNRRRFPTVGLLVFELTVCDEFEEHKSAGSHCTNRTELTSYLNLLFSPTSIMRILLIALCALGCAVSVVSAAETAHDAPTSGAAASSNTNDQFKIARSVAVTPSTVTALRGRASSVSASDRILKQDDEDGAEAQEGCDKDCEKAAKEAEKLREEQEEEAAKAAEEAEKEREEQEEEAAKAAEKAAKEAEKAAKEAAKAAEKESAAVEETIPEGGSDVAVLVDEEEAEELLAPTVNVDEGASNNDEKDEAATDELFVAVVPPTSVKEDLGDDNKAILPPPTDETIIFDTVDEGDAIITNTITNTQQNRPTGNDDGFPGPAIKKDKKETSLTFSSSSANDGGLQPVGKALLSVALAGVFVAFVAIFLLQRQRRRAADSASAVVIASYSPSKDAIYFVDRDEVHDGADVENQIVLTDTASSSLVPTPEKDGGDNGTDDDESSQPLSLLNLSCENAAKVLSMLPCYNPTMIEAFTNDGTVPEQPFVEASPSSEMEEEEIGNNLTHNNTARALMRKYQMDDVS